jgi:hypothetical protein
MNDDNQRATEEWLKFMPEFPDKRTKKPRDMDKVGRQYAEALDELRAADAKMRRAFHAYERAQKAVRRLEKILDKASTT